MNQLDKTGVKVASDKKRQKLTANAGTGAKKKASRARKVRLAEKRAAIEAEQIEQQRAAAGIKKADQTESAALPARVSADKAEPVIGDVAKEGESITTQYQGLLEGEKVALDATGSAAKVLVELMNNPRTSPDVRRKAANDVLTVAQKAKERERPQGGTFDRPMTLRDLLELRDQLIEQRESRQVIDVTPEPD